jgi:hypothetical protein
MERLHSARCYSWPGSVRIAGHGSKRRDDQGASERRSHSVREQQDRPSAEHAATIVRIVRKTFVEIPHKLRPPSFNSSMHIITTKRYNGGLFIADFQRMPFGCSLWPAYWSLGTGNWPADGEIDILEGVNKQATLVIPPFFPLPCCHGLTVNSDAQESDDFAHRPTLFPR